MSRHFKKTTQQSKKPHFVADDLIQQNFTAEELNEAWVSDISYLPTQEGWVYYTRQVKASSLVILLYLIVLV